MTTPAWRQALHKSLDSNKHLKYSTFFQLATIRPDGRPANRTVAFRGFIDKTDRLTFTTDTRTQKARDVSNKDLAEVCWYFPDSREQYRLLGQLTLVGKDHSDQALSEERQKAWKECSETNRKWFSGPPPGRPQADTTDADHQDIHVRSNEDPPVDSFALAVLDISEVDYVDLLSNIRNRYEPRSAGWAQISVNP